MAQTIQQAPPVISPAFNEIIYVISSTQASATNFRYIADIYFTNDSGAVTIAGQSYIRKKFSPDPTTSSGVINIAQEVRDQLQFDIGDDIYGSQKSTNSYIGWTVQFGEEYGTSSSGVTVYPNLVSDTAYAFNGGFNFIDFKNYDVTQYKGNSASTTRKWLTTRPSSGVIRSDERAWLHAVSNANAELGYFFLETWTSAGAYIATYKLNNNYGTITTMGRRHIRIPAGLTQYNAIPNADYISGAKPVNTNVGRYRIYWAEGAGSVQDRADQWWTVDDVTCSQHTTYRLHFLNELGGFDSFSFIRAHEQTLDIKRSDYKKNQINRIGGGQYGYNKYDKTNINFYTKIKDRVKINSDWVSETTYAWLEQLITSPVVFLDDSTNGLIAVNITDNTYTKRQHVTDKIFNMQLTFEFSYDRYRQSL